MFIINYLICAMVPVSVIFTMFCAMNDMSMNVLWGVVLTLGLYMISEGVYRMSQEDELSAEMEKFRMAEWKTTMIFLWHLIQKCNALLHKEIERDRAALNRFFVNKFWSEVEDAHEMADCSGWPGALASANG